MPQIPVYPIHYVETIDPHAHLLLSWLTMALNLLFPAHKMIKRCRFIQLSNQWLTPNRVLIPGRTKSLKAIQILRFSHLYHFANWCCAACMLFDNLCLLHVAYSHSFMVHIWSFWLVEPWLENILPWFVCLFILNVLIHFVCHFQCSSFIPLFDLISFH